MKEGGKPALLERVNLLLDGPNFPSQRENQTKKEYKVRNTTIFKGWLMDINKLFVDQGNDYYVKQLKLWNEESSDVTNLIFGAKKLLTQLREELEDKKPKKGKMMSLEELTWEGFLSNCPTAYPANSMSGSITTDAELVIMPFNEFEEIKKELGTPPACQEGVKQSLQEAVYAYCYGMYRSCVVCSVVALELVLVDNEVEGKDLYTKINNAKKEKLIKGSGFAHAIRSYENAGKHESEIIKKHHAKNALIDSVKLINEIQTTVGVRR